MKKKEVTVKFNFSYASLKQKGDNLLQLIDRDIKEFNNRGFSPAKRSAIVGLINTFNNLPDEEQMLGIRETSTENKNSLRQKLEKQMRTILLMAKNVFTESTGKYREFGNPDLSHQTDEELVRNAKIMGFSATKYLTDLKGEGLTKEKITQLNDTKTAFDDSIDEQQKAIRNKDVTAEQRIEAANLLYDEITKYSDVGKDIWSEVNEAKYNDYVIYNTPTGAAEPEEAEKDPKSVSGPELATA